MAPKGEVPPYVAVNETLPPSGQEILPYTHGLVGVDLGVNDITT